MVTCGHPFSPCCLSFRGLGKLGVHGEEGGRLSVFFYCSFNVEKIDTHDAYSQSPRSPPLFAKYKQNLSTRVERCYLILKYTSSCRAASRECSASKSQCENQQLRQLW